MTETPETNDKSESPQGESDSTEAARRFWEFRASATGQWERQHQSSRPPDSHWGMMPLVYIEWAMEWIAHWLGRLAIFKVLEYAAKFSIVVAVVFYFLEAPDRKKRVYGELIGEE